MSGKSVSEKPSPSRRRKWTIAVAVAAVALVIGFVVFKPWLLFVDVRVDEQLPIVASAPAQAQPTPPTPLTSSPGTSSPGTPPSTTTTPTPTPAGPVQLAAGTLISHEHTEQWTITNQNGVPWYTPPPHIDPTQKPQQNHYFKPPPPRE